MGVTRVRLTALNVDACACLDSGRVQDDACVCNKTGQGDAATLSRQAVVVGASAASKGQQGQQGQQRTTKDDHDGNFHPT